MSKKNKIVIIRNAAKTDFGGAERFPVFLSQELKNNGYKSVILSRSKKLIELAKSSDVKVIKSWWWQKQNWSGKNTVLFPVYIAWQTILTVYYILMFIRLRPSAVHIQSKDDFIAGTFAAKLLGKRVVWTDHADLKHIWKNVRVWYKNPLGKFVFVAARLADTVVVVSKNEQSLISSNLRENSPIANKMVLIYNGVADSLSKYNKTKNDKFTFVMASRLVTDKGIGEVIEAFNKLCGENDDVELRLLGDGPEMDKFKYMAKDNANIKFLGHLADPLGEMRNADVFLQPTYHEAFSVVLVEACMLQLAIVATNVGGNPEIIVHEATGLLVEPQDASSLYKAMRRLHDDDKLREKISKSARELFVEKFNFSNIVKFDYMELYDNPLNIRVEISPLASASISGVGNYTKLLVEAIDTSRAVELETCYYNFLDRQNTPDVKTDKKPKKNKLVPLRIYAKLQSYNIAPAFDLFKNQTDLTIFTNFAVWPTVKSKLRATVIHDLTYLYYPELVEKKNLAHLRRVVGRSIRKSDFIITVSEAVKAEIVKEFKYAKDKIVVTNIPPSEQFSQKASDEEIRNVKQKYNINYKKYIYFIGNFEPRKNLDVLIKAYALLPADIKKEYGLVLAGGSGWNSSKTRDLLNEMLEKGENIQHIGYIDQSDSMALYQGSSMFVMPSLYEGFGIPILEAMSSGVPVVASDIPVLRETAGEAALFADPNSPEEFAKAMEKIITDDNLRAKLISVGTENLIRFCWDENIGKIVYITRQLLNK